VLLALFALTQVFLALPAGRYADRHGLRRPFGFAVIAATWARARPVAFPVFPVLCLAALLTGGATGAPSSRCSGTSAAPRRAPRSSSRCSRGWRSGRRSPTSSARSPPAWLIDHAGFRLAFLLMAAVLPLVGWWWVRTARELPPVQEARPRPADPAWDLLREPMFRRLLLVNWLLSSCWDVHTFVVPVLGHERGLSAR
jgi:MFS family permease